MSGNNLVLFLLHEKRVFWRKKLESLHLCSSTSILEFSSTSACFWFFFSTALSCNTPTPGSSSNTSLTSNGGPAKASRKDKSLGLLCDKFISRFPREVAPNVSFWNVRYACLAQIQNFFFSSWNFRRSVKFHWMIWPSKWARSAAESTTSSMSWRLCKWWPRLARISTNGTERPIKSWRWPGSGKWRGNWTFRPGKESKRA